MKKRLFIIGLVLVLAMTAIMPAPVMAASGKNSAKHIPFQAEGVAMVIDAGSVGKLKTKDGTEISFHKTGEVIAGSLRARN